jgi:hypothetical protein
LIQVCPKDVWGMKGVTMRHQKQSKIEPHTKKSKISSADDLVKTSKSGDIELDEQDLKQVTGGKSISTLKYND